jgi:thiol-disulfide isomerase/thioredoxin
MKNFWKPIIIVLVAGIMAADVFLDQRTRAQVEAVTLGRSDLDLPVGTSVGKLAPDFTGTTLDGQTFRLSEMRGKTVLINVFASWCGPCRLEMPHLVELSNQVDPNEVVFVGLNLQENPDAVSAFKGEFGIEFPLVLNEDGKLTNELYTPIGLPTSWFIDQDGVVRYVFSGAMTGDVLENVLEDVIAGREPDPFDTSS